MSNISNQQSLPNNLDINSWLKLALNSASELTRQIALEEIFVSGFTPDLKEHLESISKSDVSQNCRNQATWILKLAEIKPQLKTLIKQLDIGPDYVSLQIQKGDYAKVYLCSQMLRKAPSEITLNAWRESLLKTQDPKLVETGLNILSKFGNAQDAPLAIGYLKSTSPQVVCASLSFLGQKAPDILKKYIKYGLSSKVASVLLHSVHLLRTIDEQEAIKYLSNLILNRNALVRQKALRELLLIDFNKIQDFFWQYIGREDQALLLVKAGFIVTINPNPRFPFKIYDILSISSGPKKQIMHSILKQSIETTQATGILKDKSIEEFLQEIKQYIDNKKTEQLIRIAVSNLKAGEPDIRLSAIDTLSNYIVYPKIKSLLENHLKVEKDENVKAVISSLFEEPPEPEFFLPFFDETTNNQQETSEKQVSTPKVTNSTEVSQEKPKIKTEKVLTSFPTASEFTQLPPKEQRSYLKQIKSQSTYLIAKKAIIESIDFDIKKSTALEILKIIEKFGKPEDAKQIKHLLRSKDNSVIAQAIKTIGAIDLELLMLDLNRLLSDNDPRVKAAAFEVYVYADKTAAVQYIGTMLKQTKISTRRIALSLMPQIDYPSVEPLVWWQLDHETTFELQEQTGYIIAANPTKEGINKLYEFTHDKNGELRPLFKDMWQTALTSSEQVFNMPASEIEHLCFTSLANSLNEDATEKLGYKYKSVMGENDEIASELESQKALANATPLESVILFFKKYKVPAMVTCGFIAVMSIYTVLQPDPNRVNRANPHEVASEINFLPSQESDKKTQVGDSDWQGYKASNARSILRSPKYASLMQSAAQEVSDYREEAKEKEKEYFTKLANDTTADKEDREWAEAQLSEDYRKASDAYSSQNYADAEKYYEKVVNDNRLKGYGRYDAIQKLCELSSMRGDKETWNKWFDILLKEVQTTMPEFSNLEAFNNFSMKMKQTEEISSRVRSDPALAAQMKKKLIENYRMSEEEATQAVKDFCEFKHPFEAMKMGPEGHSKSSNTNFY